MQVLRLHVNPTARHKLAARSISTDELEQLLANRPYVTPNPHPRVVGSRLLIGPTDGGRVLTVVIQPDRADPALWHVMTGWPASRREIVLFRRHH